MLHFYQQKGQCMNYWKIFPKTLYSNVHLDLCVYYPVIYYYIFICL